MGTAGISRRDFVRTAACGLGVAALGPGPTLASLDGGRTRKPNILFIITDQQTMRAMSAYGNPHVHTPGMDSIAQAGIRFEKSYCTAPICSPSRSSILTSRIPEVAGVRYNGMPVHAIIPNFGHVFRRAGYATAWAGKWHLGEYYVRDKIKYGFDHLRSEVATALGVETDEAVADEAVRYLRSRHDRPFLLGVSFVNPHDICYWIRGKHIPLELPEPPERPPLPSNFDADPDEPAFITKCRLRQYYAEEVYYTRSWNEEKWREYLSSYYQLTERVDRAIARVIAALREQHLEEDTLVIFTSDHGEGMAAHRWVVKLMLYEEPVTVPLILSWKGVTPQAAVDRDHLASGLDILPTMCDYGGVDPPEGVQGVSLRPVIEQPELPGRDFVAAELRPDPADYGMQGRMIRTGRYKYIRFSLGRYPEMLFDLETDPGETRNLAKDMAMHDTLEEHRSLLADWITRADDRFPL
jgi:arylsulfatase A-like enzyme